MEVWICGTVEMWISGSVEVVARKSLAALQFKVSIYTNTTIDIIREAIWNSPEYRT